MKIEDLLFPLLLLPVVIVNMAVLAALAAVAVSIT